jgi:hypothetical protein
VRANGAVATKMSSDTATAPAATRQSDGCGGKFRRKLRRSIEIFPQARPRRSEAMCETGDCAATASPRAALGCRFAGTIPPFIIAQPGTLVGVPLRSLGLDRLRQFG